MMMTWKSLSFYFVCVLSVFESQVFAKQSPERRLLGLIEYVSGDYPKAVKASAVIDEREYEEMKEFVSSAREIAKNFSEKLPPASYEALISDLDSLNMCVLDKCEHSDLLDITQTLRERIIKDLNIESGPAQAPDFELGKKVYQHLCSSCHGDSGRGDTPIAAALNPPPRSFHDAEYMEQASPLKFVNTLHTGIKDTAMLSFDGRLSEHEMWSVSFYLMGLRYESASKSVHEDASKAWKSKVSVSLPPSLSFLSSKSNASLQEWLQERVPAEAIQENMSFLRSLAPYASQIPVTELAIQASNSWDFVHEHIAIAKDQFDKGEFQEANDTLLDAYLDGFEKIEANLAVVDHDLLLNLERTFSVVRTYASKGDAKNFANTLLDLDRLLKDGEAKLSAKTKSDGAWNATEFISAFIIILREGFEAFLIIISLLMIVANLKVPSARAWIHAGWMSAVVFGLGAYFVFEKLIYLSGAARESVEAFCTLAATVVLFYTGFWLLSQTELNRWQKYVKAKTSEALSRRRLWMLFGLSFIAVFRESAETVLFYAALLSNAESSWVVAAGFLTGTLCLLCICLAILKFHVRLPLKRFFHTTSTFMVALSVVLAGKTVHELVAAGYIKATPFSAVPMVDALGVYPLQETLLAQGFMVALTVLILMKKRVLK